MDAPVRALIAQLGKKSTPKKPRVLYHYTSASALIGILKTKTLWATNIRFLNDSTEYQIALNIARRVIQERISTSTIKREKALFAVLEERLTDITGDVYVSSFTENGDQLSQWRAYCPTAGGYAIGFDSDALFQQQEKDTQFLVRCIYEPAEHQKAVVHILEHLVGLAETSRRDGTDQDRVLRETYKLLGRLLPPLAPMLKDPSFAEEREWRLVRLGAPIGDDSVKFRIGHSMLIPYCEHSFGELGAPIEAVCVGPTPHPDLARESTESLLTSHGLPTATVHSSIIPFRTL